MKTVTKTIFTLLALAAIGFLLGGCEGVGVSGAVYVPVYGDYGYVGPWGNDRVEVGGGYFGAPPNGRQDRDRRDEGDHGRAEAAPQRNRN